MLDIKMDLSSVVFSLIPILVLGILWCEKYPYRGRTSVDSEALKSKREKNRNPGYPYGWFRIADCDEIPEGGIVRRSVCDEEFIIVKNSYENFSEVISVYEPYCPHNGTDLGRNGFIRNGKIVCQFHEWEFDCDDGACTKIPYGDDCSMLANAKLKKAHIKVWNGCILIWYHPDKIDPLWEPEWNPKIPLSDLKVLGNIAHNLACLVDDIHENSADLAHFQFLHKSNLIPFLDSQWEGYTWNAFTHMGVGTIDHYFKLFGTNWLCSSTEWRNIGPGIIAINTTMPLFGKMILIDTTTPRGPYHTERNITIYGSKRISRLLFRLPCWMFFFVTMQDNRIWNWKKKMETPLYTKNEHELARFRRWFKRFYVQPKVSVQYDDKID